MSFEEFQDGIHGGHLGHQNGKTLAILNLYVAPMSPIKFWLNPTYGLEGDVVSSISRWLPYHLGYGNRTILASHQVSAQSDLLFGIRCRLMNFKTAAMAAILDTGTERF